jgi:hypothetical protein
MTHWVAYEAYHVVYSYQGISVKTAPSGFFVACILAAFAPAPAQGVCFYPRMDVSGYTIPLDTEVKSSSAIVIGDVVAVKALQDDPMDAGGVSGFVYTVAVSRRLKGRTPGYIAFRADNDSGAYRLNLREKHLLFLSQVGDQFTIDACGNSSQLPAGQNVVVATRRLLAKPGPDR